MIRKTITVEIDEERLLNFYHLNNINDIDRALERWVEADGLMIKVEEIKDVREPNLIDKNAQL